MHIAVCKVSHGPVGGPVPRQLIQQFMVMASVLEVPVSIVSADVDNTKESIYVMSFELEDKVKFSQIESWLHQHGARVEHARVK